jgi:hypothetical protein
LCFFVAHRTNALRERKGKTCSLRTIERSKLFALLFGMPIASMDSSSHSSEQQVPWKPDLAQPFIRQSSPAMHSVSEAFTSIFLRIKMISVWSNGRFELTISWRAGGSHSTGVAAIVRHQRDGMHRVYFPDHAVLRRKVHTPVDDRLMQMNLL